MTLATHLVGRASELDSVDRLLTQIDGRHSAALELVGEPGIGKTRLLAELAVRADARGYLVLSGRAGELELDLPFWVFVDALDEYVHGLDPQRFDGLDDDVRAELATVFPSLAGLAAGRATAIQHERYRSHRAVCTLLETLAQTQPVVLVLDDVHWADPASVELLGALLHRPPAARVFIALAVRPRQMGERLSAAIERAHRDGTIARIELGALGPEDARELVGDRADATSLYEDSGGNPFYLEQLARSGDRPDTPAAADGPSLTGVDVPAAVAASLAEELALLSKRARLILEGAAVAGDPFDPELAAAAAGARRRPRSKPSTSCCAWISSDRPTFPGAFGSGIRSSATRCTSRCPAAGGSARTSAAPMRSPSAAPCPRRSRTTWNALHVRATRPPSRYCARPERLQPRAHPQAPHAGSAPPSASCHPLHPVTSGSSCCWPAPKHSPPPGNSERATRHSSRA